MRAKEKFLDIDIEINGDDVDLVMKLDDYGVGYFSDDECLPRGDKKASLAENKICMESDVLEPPDICAKEETNNCTVMKETNDAISEDINQSRDTAGEDIEDVCEEFVPDPEEVSAIVASPNSPTPRRNTLHISKDELEELNLVHGYNEATFSVTGQFQVSP